MNEIQKQRLINFAYEWNRFCNAMAMNCEECPLREAIDCTSLDEILTEVSKEE